MLAVADELELSEAERRDAEFTALLHDVGKIRIPASIINKAGPLDAEERAVIETHTIEGEQMLERVGGLLGHVGRLVRSCHEHWDGGGYPDRLAGEEIPLVARIVCACDAFSAMTTDRPYRAARTDARSTRRAAALRRHAVRPARRRRARARQRRRLNQPPRGGGSGSSPSDRAPAARSSGVRHISSRRRELLDVAFAEPQRLSVQRLLEERAREARVPERLVALGVVEDRAQRRVGALAEGVLGLGGEAREDLDEVVGRVVRELDLAREA